MLIVIDLLEYTNKINAAIDDAMANNGTQDSPAVDELISYYTGPGTGLYWNTGERKLCIAKGWCEDEEGNIVDPTACTGPATGLEYRDGKVRKVKK